MRMVERAIKNAKDYPTKKELWRTLPRKIQYKAFNQIIKRVLSTNKIILDGRQIVWVAADNPQLQKVLKHSVQVR
jgi:adenylate kinase